MENTTPDTTNFLNWVEIKNFKSIKDLRLDCKRVNVFIGKPNVGKSNILEGLGLLGAGHSMNTFSNGFVRYKELRHLFNDNDVSNNIQIYTDQLSATLFKSLDDNSDLYRYYLGGDSDVEKLTKYTLQSNDFDFFEIDQFIEHLKDSPQYYELHGDGAISNDDYPWIKNRFGADASRLIKKYDFNNTIDFNVSVHEFLVPPYGVNLFSVVDRREELKREIGNLFKEQKLEFVLSKSDLSFSTQRKEGYYAYSYPYYSVADTFRRFIFYLAAIESNKNSVLIFEEPEVHSFPPYTQDIAYRMIYSEENQFFVSTHSPYLLQTLVSNLKDDQLNVFVTYYENYETKAKALTAEELSFVQEYSTDVFFNLDRFIPNAQSANPA